jgi:hypothetical protein
LFIPFLLVVIVYEACMPSKGVHTPVAVIQDIDWEGLERERREMKGVRLMP